MTKPFGNQNEQTQNHSQDQNKSWKESFANAAKATGHYAAKLAIPVGFLLTGAGIAFTMTNMYNKNERQIIDSVTSSNPTAPIIVNNDLQVILSDTNLTIISHGIPCDIPLDDPSKIDVILGNTGEATVSEATSILQTLGITSDSQLNKSPADNAEAILRLRYKAAADCRADILKAQGLQHTRVADAERPIAQNTADYPSLAPGNE